MCHWSPLKRLDLRIQRVAKSDRFVCDSNDHWHSVQALPNNATAGTGGASGIPLLLPTFCITPHSEMATVGLSPNRIYVGNCLEKFAELDPQSVDLVFADPPFNIGYDYDVYDDRRADDEYLAWSTQWMRGVHRSLKPNGTFWLAIGDEYAAELKVAAQREVGFHCRSWVIWYYTFGVNCVRGFSRSHTHLFHFVKDPANFVFNSDNPTIRVPSARQLVYADARANPKGRLPDNTWIFRPQDAPNSFAPSHDTWYFARVAGTFKERQGFHGCQMPEQLLGRIIRVSSNPRDLVLDPFSGSGTTLAVAKKLGRQWIGFELSEEYGQRIGERLAKVQPGDELTGPANPVESAPATSRGKKQIRTRNGRPVPFADDKVEQGVLAAYEQTCDGRTIDHVLCDPARSAAFLAECKRRGIEGAEFVWNRVLLRLRKAGKLSKSSRATKRQSISEMDPFSFASEIAMRLLEIDYGVTYDDVLCLPEASQEFDRIAAEFAPGFSPFEYRRAGLAIRKRAMQAKTKAYAKFSEWQQKELPTATKIAALRPSSYEGPGIYLLSSQDQTLYVGQTCDVPKRLEQIVGNACWNSLGLIAVSVIPCDDPSLAGLQSRLIGRLNPLLNTELLKPNRPAKNHRLRRPRKESVAVAAES